MVQRYDIARASDGSLLRLAHELLRKDEAATASFEAADGFKISVNSGSKIPDRISRIFGNSSFLITSGQINIPSEEFTFSFRRAQTYLRSPDGRHRWQEATTPFVDGIEFSGANKGDSLSILSAISSHLSFVPAAFGGDKAIKPLDQSALILDRVSDAAAQVIEHTAERQRELDSYSRELEKDALKKIAQEKTRLQSEFQAKIDSLHSQEQSLIDRAAELDDRENTHVRRELQKHMASLSDNTLNKRLLNRSSIDFYIPILLAIIFAIILSGFIYLEIRGLDQLAEAIANTIKDDMLNASNKSGLIESFNQSIMYGQIRAALQTIGVGLLVWFALKLATNRYRQVSRWESELHRFRLDTERASFLIEGDLEARKVNGQGLPEVMLDRFSRGLFTGSTAETANDSDEVGTTLGHLLSRAANVKLGTDGVSVEIDKPGIKKARRDVARESVTEE